MARSLLYWTVVWLTMTPYPLVGRAQELESQTRKFSVRVVTDEGVRTQQVDAIEQYSYSSGMSKPQRVKGIFGGGDMYGMMGGGMPDGMGGYGDAMGDMMGGMGVYGGLGAGTATMHVIMYALIRYAENAEAPERAEIQVCTLEPEMESMMGMGMGGMGGGMAGPGKLYKPLAKAKVRLTKGGPVMSVQELTNLADLVRQDQWIEQARTALRSNKANGELFKAWENELKLLLTEEYDRVLSKQQGELERLRVKLKEVEDELVRRSAAKQRVIDVQLGKFVLEAQGLIGP